MSLKISLAVFGANSGSVQVVAQGGFGRVRVIEGTNEEDVGGRNRSSNLAKPLKTIVGFEPKVEADG